MNGSLIKVNGWEEPPITFKVTAQDRSNRSRSGIPAAKLKGRMVGAARVRSVGHKFRKLLLIKINALYVKLRFSS